MIFAAGFGTRMGELTATRPKPLVEVAGKPLIDHALEIARLAEIDTVCANLHYLPDQLVAHLAPRNVKLSLEAEHILETGGGLKFALPLLGDGPVFTMNSDAVWTGDNPLLQLKDAWDPEKMDALLLLLPPDRATGHTGKGDFLMDDNGVLTRGSGMVYSGAQIIKTERLHDIKENAFSLNVLWNEMIKAQRLFGTMHNGGWCDVGHPAGISDAETLLGWARDV